MTSANALVASALALFISANVAAEEVPVIELGAGSSSNRYQVAAPAGSVTGSTELMLIVQQLQDEVRSLRGQLEQQGYRLKQMEQQQLDRYRDLDRRLSSVQQGGVVAPAGSSLSASPSTSNPAAVSSNQTSLVQADATPSDAKAYKEAFGLVRERNFPKAIEAFTAFVKDYPQSTRLVNAHYWLGEIYLAEQKPELARESFVKVVTQFPDHRKAPDAAYKLGIVYDQLGDRTKSLEYLDLVINKYPDSSAVRLAKEFKRLQ